MRRVQLKLMRRNDKGRMTVRYRWEIVWCHSRARTFLAERYGYTGDKAFAWSFSSGEQLTDFLATRQAKFVQQGDVVEVSTDEMFAETEIHDRLEEWKNAWFAESEQGQLKDKAIAALNVFGFTKGDGWPIANYLSSKWEAPVVQPVSEPSISVEENVARCANWGAW